MLLLLTAGGMPGAALFARTATPSIILGSFALGRGEVFGVEKFLGWEETLLFTFWAFCKFLKPLLRTAKKDFLLCRRRFAMASLSYSGVAVSLPVAWVGGWDGLGTSALAPKCGLSWKISSGKRLGGELACLTGF